MTIIKPSHVTVDDTVFFRSHSRWPRGRGGWLFCPSENWNHNNYLDYVKNFNGTYAEAKRAAKIYFAAAGVHTIVVCP